MRGRSWLPIIALGLLTAACAGSSFSRDRDVLPPGEVLLLGSGSGVVALDPATGAALSDAQGVPTADWSTVFSARPSGDATLVEGRDVTSGQVVSSAEVPSNQEVRVVSADGAQVALMGADDGEQWVPVPRTSTRIVVLDTTTGDSEAFDLEGNFEPEAFGSTGRLLYLVRYVPPEAPAAYRVSALDLRRGNVLPVGTSVKGLVVETMSGTRLEQVADPQGSMLFTLYTTASSADAGGHAAHGGGADPVGFVHTLSLSGAWAHCVGLPEEFWGAGAAEQAMAIGELDTLFIVNAASGTLAVMDTKKLKVVDTVDLDLGEYAGGQVAAAMSPDGETLYVANGSTISAIGAETLAVEDRWLANEPTSAVGFSSDGSSLLAGGTSGLTVLDPATGEHVGSLPSPAIDDLTYVGTATG